MHGLAACSCWASSPLHCCVVRAVQPDVQQLAIPTLSPMTLTLSRRHLILQAEYQTGLQAACAQYDELLDGWESSLHQLWEGGEAWRSQAHTRVAALGERVGEMVEEAQLKVGGVPPSWHARQADMTRRVIKPA